MKKSTITFSLAWLALAAGALAAPAATFETEAHSGPAWFDDYDEALAAAKEQGKDLFVDFAGSDWCHYCHKLENEVLAHDEWLAAARQDYILVMLDFPRSEQAKAKVPNPRRNQELAERHGVQGFPTVFLITPDEVVFARTGYQAGGPQEYVQHLAKIAAEGKRVLAPFERVAETFIGAKEGEAKWAAWDKLVASFNGLGAESPYLRILEKHVRWGFDADSNDAMGKKAAAAKALLRKGIADSAFVEFARESDVKNEKGLFELAVRAQFRAVQGDAAARAAIAALEEVNRLGVQDSHVGFVLNFTAARWYEGPLANDEKKMTFARKALELGSGDAEMMASLKKLLG